MARMPLEIQEACKWQLTRELGHAPSDLNVAVWIKRNGKRGINKARELHAKAARDLGQ